MRWYSYVLEAVWGLQERQEKRIADFVMRIRVIAPNAGDARARAALLAEDAHGARPEQVRVLEVFEVSPAESALLTRAERQAVAP